MVVYAEPGRADPLTGRVLALTFQPVNGALPEGSRMVKVDRQRNGGVNTLKALKTIRAAPPAATRST